MRIHRVTDLAEVRCKLSWKSSWGLTRECGFESRHRSGERPAAAGMDQVSGYCGLPPLPNWRVTGVAQLAERRCDSRASWTWGRFVGVGSIPTAGAVKMGELGRRRLQQEVGVRSQAGPPRVQLPGHLQPKPRQRDSCTPGGLASPAPGWNTTSARPAGTSRIGVSGSTPGSQPGSTGSNPVSGTERLAWRPVS